jgi:glycosyltransferase involved in cell wall biosynthesis
MTSCTIVIPTHNRETLLDRAVRSALTACPVDGEVLVVDDKSEIPAAHVLRRLDDPRLRVTINPGPSGAASARNWGVSQAAGEVVFFLDDDDEMVADYCTRVLQTVLISSAAVWGFASTVERSGSDICTDRSRQRRRLQQGIVPATSPLKDSIAAVSDGLWIRRDTFGQLGGFKGEQVIDEDTDLCLQLIACGKQPWYEVEPGTIVYRGYVPAHEKAAQLTVSTASLIGLDCYRRTYDRNANSFPTYSRERWFLCTRFLRRAAKQGQCETAWIFVRGLSPVPLRFAAAVFLTIKLLVRAAY